MFDVNSQNALIFIFMVNSSFSRTSDEKKKSHKERKVKWPYENLVDLLFNIAVAEKD